MTKTDELEMYELLWKHDLLLGLPLPTLKSVLDRFAGDKAKDVLLYEIKLVVGSYGIDQNTPQCDRYHEGTFDFAHFDNFRKDMLLLTEFPGGFQAAVDYMFEIFEDFIDFHSLDVSDLQNWIPNIDRLFDTMLEQCMLARRLDSCHPHQLVSEIGDWRANLKGVWTVSSAIDDLVPFKRSRDTLLRFFEDHARTCARLLAVKTSGAILPPELMEMIEDEYVLIRMSELRGE